MSLNMSQIKEIACDYAKGMHSTVIIEDFNVI
jgi:hypothetical protein